jgi:hypothetical protein
MLLWSLYSQLEPTFALFPTFHLVGILGLETFRAENAYRMETINAGKVTEVFENYYIKSPINYLETAIGLGFDWDFAGRAGLHVRYKWMTHSDENISENDWHSHYISAETKVWF